MSSLFDDIPFNAKPFLPFYNPASLSAKHLPGRGITAEESVA
jgi:hypothetical protein